ncbi:unnamed protein product [Ectocarpus sp. 6 AP-2014]
MPAKYRSKFMLGAGSAPLQMRSLVVLLAIAARFSLGTGTSDIDQDVVLRRRLGAGRGIIHQKNNASKTRNPGAANTRTERRTESNDTSAVHSTQGKHMGTATEKQGGGSGGAASGARTAKVVGDGAQQDEANSIVARDRRFLLKPENWQHEGHGISITAKGEPKSGTTWLGRLMPQLALELCGSSTNTWCEMGGLAVYPNEPSPWYEFELLKKGTGEGGGPTLFLHYKGSNKHVIPGMSWKGHPEGCNQGGRRHRNFFEDDPPCISGPASTREQLTGCLWKTSSRCMGFVPTESRRTAVMLRDPRDVVLSEFRMRRDYYHQEKVMAVSVDDFIWDRFQTIVSWTHQRWVWHTETVLSESSHVMFYDDLQANPMGMIDLAAFMGLECSEDQARKVWESHQNAVPHGDYTTHGLQLGTIEWMNATMASLLPTAVSLHWGLNPTDT